MFRKIVVLFFVVALCYAGDSFSSSSSESSDCSSSSESMGDSKEHHCGRNQQWTECGTNCEPRCDNSHIKMVCTALCVEKCQCIRGYLRNNGGECVLPQHCKHMG